MKLLPTIFLCLATGAILMVASGCGSSEGSDGPRLTKTQFIAKGDAICRKSDQRQESGLRTYPKSHPSVNLNSKEGEEEMVLKVGLPPVLTATHELEQLRPPEEDEEKVEAIIEGMREGVAIGRKDPLAIAEGASNPFSEADRLASAYGFKACSAAL